MPLHLIYAPVVFTEVKHILVVPSQPPKHFWKSELQKINSHKPKWTQPFDHVPILKK